MSSASSNPPAGVGDEDYDYKAHANLLKDQGNELFQAGNNEEAIRLYTQAIELDPDNHIFYSNRSAAYMKCDSKSKALYDAEKCVQLAPNWSKGYVRLGAAQQSLKRFDAAIDTFKKGIELDSSNQSLWSALRSCQEAHENDKKSRFAAAAAEREREAERLRRMEEAKSKAAADKATEEAEAKRAQTDDDLAGFFSELADTKPVASKPVHDTTDGGELSGTANGTAAAAAGQDDLLAGFFSEVLEQPKPSEKPAKDESLLTDKYTNQDLGDAKSQYERIMAKNYEWRNLNPYYVLQLDVDATEEDIKQRYRKLSVKLHPDKMRDVEHARECFEQIKTAYQKLCDEKEKSVIVMNIEHIREEVAKERKRAVAKGAKEADFAPLEEEQTKRIMKHFAEMEMLRRQSEKNLRAYSAREKMQEKDEQDKLVKEMEMEKQWAEGDRREKRVGMWRDFQEAPGAKKSKLSNYKEELRTDGKHGVVKLNEWKKSWK